MTCDGYRLKREWRTWSLVRSGLRRKEEEEKTEKAHAKPRAFSFHYRVRVRPPFWLRQSQTACTRCALSLHTSHQASTLRQRTRRMPSLRIETGFRSLAQLT